MANTALTNQAGQIFGTGQLVTAGTDQYSKEAELPSVPGVAGTAGEINPFMVGQLNYSSPSGFAGQKPATEEQEDTATSINDPFQFAIENVGLEDRTSIQEVPEFENLSDNTLSLFGLAGVTPKSLDQTFTNLTASKEIDLTSFGLQTLNNLSRPAGALAAIATGRTQAALESALKSNNPLAAPFQALQAYNVLDTLSKFSWDEFTSLPDRAVTMVGDLIDVMAEVYDAPLETAEKLAGMFDSYNVFGTFSPKNNSYNFGEQTVNIITDKKSGALATPGMITSMLPGPMKAAPIVGMALTDFMSSILPGPGYSYEEQTQYDMQTMDQAQRGVEVDLADIAPGLSMHSGPYGSVLSFNEVDIPGLGPISGVADMGRLTAEYSTAAARLTGMDITASYGLSSAQIANTMAGLDTEQEMALNAWGEQNLTDLANVETEARATAIGYQSIYDAYNEAELGVTAFDLDDPYGVNTATGGAVASYTQDPTGMQAALDWVGATLVGDPNTEETARSASFAQNYPNAYDAVTNLGLLETMPSKAMDFEAAHPFGLYNQHRGVALGKLQQQVTDKINAYGENMIDSYNTPGVPSVAATSIAQAYQQAYDTSFFSGKKAENFAKTINARSMQINNAFFDGSNLTQEEIEAIAEVEAAGLATYDFTNTDVTDLTSGLAGLGADFAEAAAAEAAEAAATASLSEAAGEGMGSPEGTEGFDGHW